MVDDLCMFDIMELPEESLKKAVSKTPARMVTRLIMAYPRALGRTLSNLLAQSMSPATLEFLRDEMHSGQLPSLAQIREAERVFIRVMHDQDLLPVSIREKSKATSFTIA